jgi:hypothetical protein
MFKNIHKHLNSLSTTNNQHLGSFAQSYVKRNNLLQLLHVIFGKLWALVLVAILNETCYLVQIYTIFFLEAQMVELFGLNTFFGML